MEHCINKLNDNFEEICAYGNKDDIIYYVNKFNIDINSDDGYFLEIIACRNDLELFKLMVELGGNIKLNNNGSLQIFAHNGNLDAVKYIINECGGDYKVLMRTTAMTNYDNVHNYIKKNYID